MPKNCCIPGCTANKKKNPDINFYCFPAKESLRRKWITAVRRCDIDNSGRINKAKKNWSPKTKSSYVCSLHFISGKKESFEEHPDSVPSVFPGKSKRIVNGKSPHCASTSRAGDVMKRYQRKIERSSAKRKLVDDRTLPSAFYSFKEGVDYTIDTEDSSITVTDKEKVVAVPDETLALPTPVSTSERKELHSELDALRCEKNNLMTEMIELKTASNPFSVLALKKQPTSCKMLTGLEFNMLEELITYLGEDLNDNGRPAKLDQGDQILITVIKLKQDLNFEFIAYTARISKTTVIDYFYKWIDKMYRKLKDYGKLQDREHIYETIPGVFKAKSARKHMPGKNASVRIHIERVVGLMKNRYTILKGIIPKKNKNVKEESVNNILTNCDKIVTVCAALTNLGPGSVFSEKEPPVLNGKDT